MPDREAPAFQFTIRTLMISVAIAALLLYLGRYFDDRLFFGDSLDPSPSERDESRALDEPRHGT